MSSRWLLIGCVLAVSAVVVPGPWLGVALAKRTPPPVVKPVVVNGIEYRAGYERFVVDGKPAGLRNHVEAVEVRGGKVLWKTRVYEITYQQNLETDVQDVYITKLSVDRPGELLVETEGKQKYRIELASGKVKIVPAS